MPRIDSRPDFSNFLGHFTANRAPTSGSASNPAAHVKGTSAFHRLVSILEQKTILAGRLPWTGSQQAVCLTECPWPSLLDHAKQYSAYGLGFDKSFVFSAGGGPAYYVRADHYRKQDWSDAAHPFVTLFWPEYRTSELKTPASRNHKTVDYSHEREWRVPKNLEFDYADVQFVILDTYEDMARFPKKLKDAIGRRNFLLMENYKNIARKWPGKINAT